MSETVRAVPETRQASESGARTPADPGTGIGAVRLVSLDALRGFDMMLIVGGELVVAAAAQTTRWPWLAAVERQFHHATWNGFTFYDLIFPLFIFLAGASMPFSFGSRLARGDSKRAIYRHVVTRGVVLVLLGMVYNGVLQADVYGTRYESVLGRIGLASTAAAFIVLNTRVRGQMLWIAGLLLGYWAAMKLIPVPGHGAGDLAMGHNLADYVDRALLPGRLHDPGHDPEGLLSTVPAVATALFGCLTGELLRDARRSGYRKVLIMASAGVAGVALGWIWNLAFPVNKNLWTSSFAVLCAGLSVLLLAAFYLVADVWQVRRWTFPLVVIGANSILIYLAYQIVDFERPAHFLFDGALKYTGGYRPLFWSLAVLLVEWLALYGLYRKRIFLKV